MRLYEVAFAVNNRNRIADINHIRRLHREAIDSKTELYRSVYYYDEKLKEHFNVKNSIKGYIGNSGLEKLIFDFDKKELSDAALLGKIQYFVKELIDDWLLPSNSIKVWFSGRGYHITTPDFFRFGFEPKLYKTVKTTIAKYFPDVDLSIYDQNSLIRVNNTINPKVNRFKIHITNEELYHISAEEIIKFSEDNRIIPIEPFDIEEVTIYQHKIVYPVDKPIAKGKDSFTTKITCMQKAYSLGPVKGKRHLTMLRIASSWRRAGMPIEAIVASLKLWANDMDGYEIEKTVKDIFRANNNEGYNYGCSDPIMAEYCDERCVFFKNKDLIPTVIDHKTMENNFVNFIRSDYKTNSIDLMKVLNVPNKSYMIIPGENILFFGNGGLGKTGLAQNIALNANHLKVLYGNFEFTTNLLYRRFVQIKNNMSKKEVMNYYQINNNSLSKGLEHIKIIDNSIDLKGLYQTIESYEPGLIILDTILKIRTSDKNEYSKSVTLSNVFKKIAKDYRCIVMAINHIPKSETSDGRGNPKKLNQHSGKGAGDLENMSDHVLMLEGKEDSDLRTLSAGKARDEQKFNLPFKYDWDKFIFRYIGS
jgi:hypothetical protein